jgi:hypothetical protein
VFLKLSILSVSLNFHLFPQSTALLQLLTDSKIRTIDNDLEKKTRKTPQQDKLEPSEKYLM